MKGIFDRITYPRHWDYKPTKKTQRECVGWDTETVDGYAKIASDGLTWAKLDSLDDALSYLTRRTNRRTIGVFYNLNFDVAALFKYDRAVLRALAKDGQAVTGDYSIRYIPSKALVIRTHPRAVKKKDGKTYTNYKDTFYYFDIAQFYAGTTTLWESKRIAGLAAAAKVYLGQDPHELKGDRARLFNKHPAETIAAYCMDDAAKTRQLAELVIQSLNAQGLVTNRLYSCGYVAQQYAQAYADVPTSRDAPRIVNRLYHSAYRGGWFDNYQRGIVTATTYDLKSAYPWALRQLPDLRQGQWKKCLDHSDVGVVHCSVHGGAQNGQPLAVKFAGRNVYPVFDADTRLTLTFGEYWRLKPFFSLKPLQAYAFHPFIGCPRPYEGLLDRLFAEKEKYPSTDARYLMAKKIMNSFYGKSAELRKDGASWKAGKMFNPCYAAEITARVRMRMFDAIREHAEHVVSILTDGVIFDAPISLPCGKNLGDWELKHHNEPCVVLSSGVYEYHAHHAHDTRCYQDGVLSCGMTEGQHCGERATRGFSKSNSLYELLDTDHAVKTVTHRPTKLKEAVIQKRMGDIGVFADVEKELRFDTDLKRLWPEDITKPRDLLGRAYASRPLYASFLGL
jgi:hypothetical protein